MMLIISRINMFLKFNTFYLTLFQDRTVSEIKECVSSSKLIEKTVAEIWPWCTSVLQPLLASTLAMSFPFTSIGWMDVMQLYRTYAFMHMMREQTLGYIILFVSHVCFFIVLTIKNLLLISMFWDSCRAEKWLAFLYYDRCLKPICCPSHILLKGYPWEALIWWMLSNSFVQTKRLGKVNHLPQPRGLGWFFVCESSKA